MKNIFSYLPKHFTFLCVVCTFIASFFAATQATAQSWLWAKSGTGNSAGDGVQVGTDAAGNVYMSGNFYISYSMGGLTVTNNAPNYYSNFFVAKLDPSGNVLWMNTSGCNNDCTMNGMCTDAMGNVYIAGNFDGGEIGGATITFGSVTLTTNGEYNSFLVKYDPSGNVIWAKGAGGAKNQVQDVAADLHGHVFFCGIYQNTTCTIGSTTLPSYGNNDSFIAELDSNGNALWAEPVAGADWDDVYSIGVDAAGNAYVSGYSGSSSITFGSSGSIVTLTNTPYAIFLAKFDGSGNCVWAKNTTSPGGNGLNWNTATAVDATGNSYLTGYMGSVIDFGNSVSLSQSGTNNYFVAKYDTHGNAVWAQSTTGPVVGLGYDVATDNAGNVYTAGYFNGPSVTFGNKTITSSESQSCFLVEYDTAGNVLLALNPVGTSSENGEGVAVDNSGNIFLGGSSLSDTLYFGSVMVNCNNENDPFIAKYGSFGNKPVANFVASNTIICQGGIVNFTDESTGVPVNRAWTFTGGTPGSSLSQSPVVTYNDTGTFAVKLVVSNSSGMDSITKTSYITVVANAVAGEVRAFPDSICAGNSSQLMATGSSGNLQWQSSVTGNNYTSIVNADSSSYSTPQLLQTTYYRLIAGSGACADTSPVISVLVNPTPVPPVLSASDSAICASDSALISTNGSYSSYLWNNGDTRAFTYAKSAGGYWVSVTNADGCTTVSAHQNISVFPVSSVSIIVQGDTLSSFNAVTYQWFRNDSIIQGATAPFYVANQSGNYDVAITDTNGCIVTSSAVSITGTNDLSRENEITIYPNPVTSGNLQMVVSDNWRGSPYEIYDAEGRIIYSSQIRERKSEIEFSGMSKGVYMLTIRINNQTKTFKLIKL